MIEPPPLAFIAATPCLVPRKTPSRLTAISALQSSSAVSSTLPSWLSPAMLTTMSSLPKVSSVASMAVTQSSSDETSWRTEMASPPAARIWSTTEPRVGGAMSVAATLAPSRASSSALARPSPMTSPSALSAPVTSATLPLTRSIGATLSQVPVSSFK